MTIFSSWDERKTEIPKFTATTSDFFKHINTPRSNHAMLRETAKSPRAISDTLVHGSTIRERLNKHDLFGRFSRRKPLLSKENLAAWLRLAKLHLNKTQEQCFLDRQDQSGDVWP